MAYSPFCGVSPAVSVDHKAATAINYELLILISQHDENENTAGSRSVIIEGGGNKLTGCKQQGITGMSRLFLDEAGCYVAMCDGIPD